MLGGRHWTWAIFRRLGLLLATLAAGPALVLAEPAQALTTTITFDPPTFAPGQILGAVGDVEFLDAPVVFVPQYLTASSPQALRNGLPCDELCANGAHRLRLRFAKDVTHVEMRVGAESQTFCFPEGIDCHGYARLVAYDAEGNAVADSRDVRVTELCCDGVSYGAILYSVAVSDPNGRIRSATLFNGRETFATDYENPSRAMIDDLVVEFADAPPPPPPKPNPPVIDIVRPSLGERLPYPYGSVTGSVNAAGGLFAFCIRVNDAAMPRPDQCLDTPAAATGTFSIPLQIRLLHAGTNALYAYAFDFSGQRTVVAVPFELQPVPQPTVEITVPQSGWQYGEGETVRLSGIVVAPGLLSGICIMRADSAPPLRGACQGGRPGTERFYLDSIRVPDSILGPGTNTIRVYAYDLWDQYGYADVTFHLPTDIRVIAMEVTQGIQSAEGFAQNFVLEGLGAGAEGVSAERGIPQSYRGVRLANGAV